MKKISTKKGETPKEITLSNAHLQISFSPCGAAVRKINFKKKGNIFKNIAFTLKPEEACLKNTLYAGATLAPAAGRIENGILRLDGNSYRLTRNELGKHHLHGGDENLSFAFWEITKLTDDSLTFSAFLKDKTDGYPGNRTFSIEYILKGNCLEIRQYAQSDKKTYFNLSNHTYFNLNAFSASGLDQYLTITADQVVLNNEEHIPQRIVNTAGTEFDFLSGTSIQKRINSCPGSNQFQTARGLNHYFLLSKREGESPACSLLSSDKKSALHLYTDAPALVLYSGGFMDASSHYVKNDGTFGDAYSGCAVAIEPSCPPSFDGSFQGITKFERFIRWEFEM